MRRAPAIALLACLLLLGATAQAQMTGTLRAKVESARGKATVLAAEIRATREGLTGAEAEAGAATARERRLSDLLAGGRERAAELGSRVTASQRRLTAEKRRLRRARGALSSRLVAIYTGGMPSAVGIVLESGDLGELAVRSEYLGRIESSDAELAERVEGVREAVGRELRRVAGLKARVEAHNERLEAARAEIAAVRAQAEAASAKLRSLRASRSASLATLKAKIGEWVRQIEAAEAASRAEAERTVGRWLGGPYSIPTYIVMCESGGDYGALNPSSGAGGAYQIIPSTWAAYGGRGAPHEAPKAEQDRIAAQIWADSGGGAWVCA